MTRLHLARLSLTLIALLTMTPAPTGGQTLVVPAPAIIDTQDAPSLGPDNAPVTIVEFGDFQCPSCAQGAKALRRYQRTYPNQMRWVFKHYPLRALHPAAQLAHEAAVAAQEQGKFWQMHDLILQNQTRVRYSDLMGYAEQIGLDMAAFKDALDTRRLRPRVIRDVEEARRLRVNATPTYFVNGTPVVGARTTAELRMIVDSIIRAPATPGGVAPAPGTAPAPAGIAPAPAATAPAPAESTTAPSGDPSSTTVTGSAPAEGPVPR
jgi:protein-disulfide isomerase